MKQTTYALLAFLIAAAAGAQTFDIGPRVSNYSTKMNSDFLQRLDTGRVSAYGLVGAYRNGAFVLDWTYDHDPQNGISLLDVIVDTGDYSRDRGEATVGFAAAPMLDLQGGVRLDQIRVGGVVLFGNTIASDLDIDHQALVAGVRLHSPSNQPVAFYVLARGIFGTAKFKGDLFDSRNVDTTGYRGEFGIPIRLGESNWRIVPGGEYEHLQATDAGFRMNTNRFFLNFVYSSRP